MVPFPDSGPGEQWVLEYIYKYKCECIASFSYSLPWHLRARIYHLKVRARTQCIGVFLCFFIIFRIALILNRRKPATHGPLDLVITRIYVSLILSCPSRAFIWSGGAEYPIIVWSISSTNSNDSCWPALFLQSKIKAKMILHFFSGIVVRKSDGLTEGCLSANDKLLW